MNVKDILKLVDKELSNSNISEAKSLLDKEIKNKPNIYELNFKLGIVNQILGNFEEALNYYEKTALINPDFSPAFCNLGIVYSKLHNKNLAIKNYLIAIQLDQKNFKSLYNLANCYLDSDDLDNAQKYYHLSIEVEPRNIHAYTSLFQIYDISNNNDKLNEILSKAKKIFGTNPYINFMEGISEYRKKNYLNSISILKNVQIDKTDISKNTIILNTIAKSRDHLGTYEEAFKAFQISNKITHDAYKNIYNKDNYNKLIQSRINFFSNSEFKNFDKITINDEHVDPIFLVGFPRSGTTLLDTILRTHGSIKVLEEKPFINKLINKIKVKMNGDFSNLYKFDNNYIAKLRSSYFKDLHNLTPIEKSKIYVDKFPLNIIYLAEINYIFPNAKYILALRNPFDCVLSCFMQPFTPNDAMSNFYNLHDASKFYDQVMKLWTYYEKKLNLELHTIKYEDTVNNFDTNILNLLNFLNLEWNDQLKEFYKTAEKRGIINTPSYNQINQPLYKNSIDRWKNYKKYFEDVENILKKWSFQFNYKL